MTYGRMGNFLFQAATAAAYAWKHGLEYTLPTESTKKSTAIYPVYLQHLVSPRWDPDLQEVIIMEKGFPFQNLPFQSEWREMNILLDGYWQSEKYFKHYRDQLLDAWALPWTHALGYVSVHVRRGDYLRLLRKHPPVPKSWLEKAMKLFPGYRFIFFSDDIPWCQATFGDKPWITYSEGQSETEDLVAMSCCEHHICSASTFSWWGAWLNQNPNKQIVMPKLWFVPGYQGIDVRDIVPKEWRRL